MYFVVTALLHYNNHDDVIHACVSKACVSSMQMFSDIKRILSTTAMCVSSSSFMYLCIPCYCDTCLKSSALRVGVKTSHNTNVVVVASEEITNISCFRLLVKNPEAVIYYY